jgi:hypothetical protein
VVNELWEGPRNVLQAQVHRDLQRAAAWYPPGDLVRGLLEGVDPARVAAIADEVSAVVAHTSLVEGDAATVSMCRRWDAACRELIHAFQDEALRRVEEA